MKDLAIGIDIGGTSIKVGFISEEGKILHRFSLPLSKRIAQEKMLERLAKEIKKQIKVQSLKEDDFLGIGIGCPGAIDSKNGICLFAGNLGWKNAGIFSIFQKHFHLPLRITNDANAATLGEARFGAGSHYQNLIMLTLGTGVGGGIYLNGSLYEGNLSQGAELGYMIIEKDGKPCTSGLRGTLETFASATALIRITKKHMRKHPESLLWKEAEGSLKNVGGRTAFRMAKLGDPAALKVVEEYEDGLAIGLINYCNIFRPEAIILGGGISNEGEYLLVGLRERMRRMHYGYFGAPEVKLLISDLKNDAGMIGAASLVL